MMGIISINKQRIVCFYLEMSEKKPLNELFDLL
jgi:hypothetical protein